MGKEKKKKKAGENPVDKQIFKNYFNTICCSNYQKKNFLVLPSKTERKKKWVRVPGSTVYEKEACELCSTSVSWPLEKIENWLE